MMKTNTKKTPLQVCEKKKEKKKKKQKNKILFLLSFATVKVVQDKDATILKGHGSEVFIVSWNPVKPLIASGFEKQKQNRKDCDARSLSSFALLFCLLLHISLFFCFSNLF